MIDQYQKIDDKYTSLIEERYNFLKESVLKQINDLKQKISEETDDFLLFKLVKQKDDLYAANENLFTSDSLTGYELSKLEVQKLDEKKQLRTKLVSEIKVTVNDHVFDGNEESQSRMTRAIQSLVNPSDKIEWKLADNSITEVTKEELQEALQIALLAQKELWFF